MKSPTSKRSTEKKKKKEKTRGNTRSMCDKFLITFVLFLVGPVLLIPLLPSPALGLTFGQSQGLSPSYNSKSVTFFGEPYLGYGLGGSVQTSGGQEGSSVDSYSGIGFGSRLGIEFGQAFFGGFDFSILPAIGYSSGLTGGTLIPNPQIVRVSVMGGAALQFIPLRFWLGYNFLDIISNLNNPGLNIDLGATGIVTLEGFSLKGGLGYRLMPYLSLNVEYFLVFYQSVKTSVNSPLPSGYSAQGNMLLLSISTPLGFSF